MTVAVASFEYAWGETVSFALDILPEANDGIVLDGSETVRLDFKRAKNGNQVPPLVDPVLLSVTPVFVAAAGGEPAHYLITLTPAQVEALGSGDLITDARITLASGVVLMPKPLALQLAGVVTAP